MQNANRKLKKLGGQMKKVGKSMSVGITAPLLGIGTLAVKTFADFEQAMAKVSAISGATGSQFKKLEESALALGRSTRYTSAEVANLQLNYSKLGFSPDEILKVTAATLDLALATGEDLALSATVAASTLRGFGLDAGETNRVVDVMAASFSGSALDLEKFKVAMSSVAPVAKNADESLESTTGMLAVLVNRGVDASTAGTGLRNVLLRVAKSGGTLKGELNKIATSANKNATAMQLFGTKGATVATILADNYKEADKFADSFENAEGAAKKMAGIMDNTLTGSLLKLKSAVEGSMISIGDKLAPIILKMADYVSGLATKFTNLSDTTQKTILIIAGLTAAIGPLLLGLGYLMTNVIPGLITVFVALKGAILTKVIPALTALKAAIISNPYLALIAVVLAAGVAMYKYAGKTNRAAAAQERLNKAIKEGKDSAQEYKDISNAATQSQIDLIKENAREQIAKTDNEKKINEIRKQALNDIIALLTEEQIKVGENVKQYATASTQYAADSPKRAQYNATIKEEAAYYNELGKRIRSLTIDKLELGKTYKPKTTTTTSPSTPKVSEDYVPDELKGLDELLAVPDIIGDAMADAAGKSFLGTMAEATENDIEKIDGDITALIESMAEKTERISEIGLIFSEAIGSAFGALGSVLAETLSTGNVIFDSFVQTIVQGLAQLAAAFVQNLIIEKLFGVQKKTVDYGKASSNAIVIATNAAAALGPAGIGALPGLIASQIGVVSAAFAGISAFADGGIVGGSSFYGDKLLARVNSGELILNEDQQKKLYNMTNSNSTNVNVGLDGSFRLDGQDLILAVERATKRNNRTS